MALRRYCDRCDMEIKFDKFFTIDVHENKDAYSDGPVKEICQTCKHSFDNWYSTKEN